MDINALLALEQEAFLRANSATSKIDHKAALVVAGEYGARLAGTGFPHRPYAGIAYPSAASVKSVEAGAVILPFKPAVPS